MGLREPWFLAFFCASELLHSATADLPALHPACRKSPEVHELKFPDASGKGFSQKLLIFGGKGYSWIHKKKKHHHHQKKWKKKVHMFGDSWVIDVNTQLWEEVQLPFDVLAENSPIQRWKPSSSQIENHTGMALFGGCWETNVEGVLDDFWIFRPGSCCPSSGRWQRIRTKQTPRARRGHVAVSFDNRFIIYGGKGYTPVEINGSYGECLRDTWILETNGWSGEVGQTWRRGADFPSGCRWGATGRPLRAPNGTEYLALFGGRNLKSGFVEHEASGSAYTYYNELWLYEPVADAWHLEEPEGPRPHPRDHHGAAMIDGDLFVFGGRVSELRSADAILGDLWSFSLLTRRWVQHHSVGPAPCARYMPGVASVHYKGEDSVAVFAGESLPGSTKRTTMNDVWVYQPSTSLWTLISSSDCSPVEYSALTPPVTLEQESLAAEVGAPPELRSHGALAFRALAGLTAASLLVGMAFKLLQRRQAEARGKPEETRYVSML